MRKILIIPLVLFTASSYAQQSRTDSSSVYKKRVLENSEISFLTSYYMQDGDHAAVSGGIGNEKLTDFTPTIVISIPINEDDVLKIDAGVSAYTSASSSNVDPFDGGAPADPFQASSGASSSDNWINLTGSYSHSSDDRNDIWTAKISLSNEYDYSSIGLGGYYTKLFNEKNTEFSLSGNIYIDKWKIIYPRELRSPGSGNDDEGRPIDKNNITGNTNYQPSFTPLNSSGRNSYSLGMTFSQILSRSIQGSLMFDVVRQNGLLSTPFQRVYFQDVEDSFLENFQLADDIERLPDSRLKVALGSRLNVYLNEFIVLRTYYRYYADDWGITSHTASMEIPLKIGDKITLSPSYRFYNQTATDYFAPHEQHLSSSIFYTSDYDLSSYDAHNFGLGLSYTDILTQLRMGKIGLKSVDVKFNQYQRNTGLSANIFSLGLKFIVD